MKKTDLSDSQAPQLKALLFQLLTLDKLTKATETQLSSIKGQYNLLQMAVLQQQKKKQVQSLAQCVTASILFVRDICGSNL